LENCVVRIVHDGMMSITGRHNPNTEKKSKNDKADTRVARFTGSQSISI